MMNLDELKDLVEKGLTNSAIAEAINLSVRQVQRLKQRLLESKSKPPRTVKDLLKILAKKAAQGDTRSVILLLKEFKEPPPLIEPCTYYNEISDAERAKAIKLIKLILAEEQETLDELLKLAEEKTQGTTTALKKTIALKGGDETSAKEEPDNLEEGRPSSKPDESGSQRVAGDKTLDADAPGQATQQKGAV